LVDLAIDGAPPRRAELPLSESFDGQAFLLRPDMPAEVAYTVVVTVQAVDASGQVLASGGASGRVDPLGCNRLQATLSAPVVAGTDLSSLSADLGKACSPSSPDEDGDGVADDCDACPADYDPGAANSDGDELPDGCDPDGNKAGNVTRMFEPFRTAGRFSGGAVTGGELVLQSSLDAVLATDDADLLPNNVRAEVWLQAAYFLTVHSTPVRGELGVFLGDAANPASSTVGMLCVVTHAAMGPDSLDLYRYTGGTATVRTTIALQPLLATSTTYRLRLDQRGGAFRCEAATNGQPATVVTDSIAAPSGNWKMSLRVAGTEGHFAAVYTASTLP